MKQLKSERSDVMSDNILRIEDVKRDFKRQSEVIHAVRGVNMEIKKGSIPKSERNVKL